MIPTGRKLTVAVALLHVVSPQQEELLVTVVPHSFIPLTISEKHVRPVNFFLFSFFEDVAHMRSKSHPIQSQVLVSVMKPIKVEWFPQK